MSEWISRQEAIDYVERIIYVDQYYHPYSKSRNVPLDEVIDRIKQVPVADVVPVRHGRWIDADALKDCGTMDSMMHEITTKAQETTEEFIFTTIQPFCEGVVQRKISKQELITALLLYEKARQIICPKGDNDGEEVD